MRPAIVIRLIVFALVAAFAIYVYYSRRDWAGNNRAVTLMNQGRAAEAVTLLEQLHHKHPTDPMVARNLGAAYEQTNQIEKAYDAYTESLRLNPNQNDVKQQMDALQEKRDLLTRAHERVQRMKAEGWQDEPGVTMDLLSKQAEAHVQMDKHKEAILLLERMLFRQPDNTDLEARIEQQEQMLKTSEQRSTP